MGKGRFQIQSTVLSEGRGQDPPLGKEGSSELVPDRTRQNRRSRAPQDGVGLGQLIWKKRTGLGFLPSTVPTLT